MQNMNSMKKILSIIPDPRRNINRKHNLIDIIILSIFGIVAGCDSWVEIENYGKIKIKFLRKFLKLKNGVPSHDTLGRVFSLLKADLLQEVLKEWVWENIPDKKIQNIAIDGKAFKATSSDKGKFNHLGMVNAWSSDK